MATATGHHSIEAISRDLKEAAAFIGQRVINREEVIEQAICALLTAEHLLLQSRTGVGKSLLAEQIFAMFEGAMLFRVQASKEQQPDTYFGGLDLEQLKSGRIIHNTEGSLVESEFGFIDEIFDANDFTLRALLSLLNERRLIRGVQNVPSRLHTVIAATNYLRVSEVTEALLDRFLFKAVILPDKDPFIQYRISQQYLEHGGRTIPAPKKISFAELQHMHAIITGRDEGNDIRVSSEVLYFTNVVIRHYEYLRNRALHDAVKSGSAQDFYISPRTQAKALDLLRALALLKGRSEVIHDDVSRLYFIFASVGLPDEIATFKKAYQTVYNSLTASRGFDQVTILLDFSELLEDLRQQPTLMKQPLHTFATTTVRRNFVEWIKEKFGQEQTADHNKKLLEQFLTDFIPVCDEVRELKHSVERKLQQTLIAVERELNRV
ncbi:MAG: MoxR family ATPase [Candidatus Kapabacteria bacterium]|nr:MoxR family ATPase [Candidatus Kapabacteria bacterium]